MLAFDELEKLRRRIEELRKRHEAGLKIYHSEVSGGFVHRHNDPKLDTPEISTASTATCVTSLIAAQKWSTGPWAKHGPNVAKTLLRGEWRSAELPKNNVFTVSFILESASFLLKQNTQGVTQLRAKAAKARKLLLDEILRQDEGKEKGGASVQDYPPSAYLTHLVFRALAASQDVPGWKFNDKRRVNDANRAAREWASRQVARELALESAGSRNHDPYQLAYATILTSMLAGGPEARPQERLLVRTGIARFFAAQQKDGSWPRSQPLFHYPSVGAAFCFEYELLAQLIERRELSELLLEQLPHLRDATNNLAITAYQLNEEGALGWSSGHHPQLKGPESWSTASVYHFAHALDRLIAEAVRRALFDHVDAPYRSPSAKKVIPKLPSYFLDCPLNSTTLKEAISQHILKPLADQVELVRTGRAMKSNAPTCLILYGPPGTSKSGISGDIAKIIGWPHVTIDPSHFARKGLDQVQAEADRIFGMLEVAEEVVVLLDEFDEMVRDRDRSSEILSRFLTTAMLPKLSRISSNRRIIFVVATNHIENFDLAIRRPGRFDVVLQVMPPLVDEKLNGKNKQGDPVFPHLRTAMKSLRAHQQAAKEELAHLTFLETQKLDANLEGITDPVTIKAKISEAVQSSVLKDPVDPKVPERTWAVMAEEQAHYIRVG